jgi:hypothetical protein
VNGVGPGKSLVNKIMQAQLRFTRGDTRGSCRSLRGFTHEVKAQDGKKIEHPTALQLLQEAASIENALGCR